MYTFIILIYNFFYTYKFLFINQQGMVWQQVCNCAYKISFITISKTHDYKQMITHSMEMLVILKERLKRNTKMF